MGGGSVGDFWVEATNENLGDDRDFNFGMDWNGPFYDPQ